MEPVNFLQSPALKLAPGYVCGEAGQDCMRFSSPQRYAHDDLPGAMDVREDLDMAIGRCEQVSEDVGQEDGKHEGTEEVELEEVQVTNVVVYQMEDEHEALVKSEVIVAEGQQEVVIESVCEEIVVQAESMDVDCVVYDQDGLDGHGELVKVGVHEEILAEVDAPSEVYEICQDDVELIVGEVLECDETEDVDVEGVECDVSEANEGSKEKLLEISLVEIEESGQDEEDDEQGLEVIDIEPIIEEVSSESEDNGDIPGDVRETREVDGENHAEESGTQEIGPKEEEAHKMMKEIDENLCIVTDSTEMPLDDDETLEIEDGKIEVRDNECNQEGNQEISEDLKAKPPESEENHNGMKDNHLGHEESQENQQKINEDVEDPPQIFGNDEDEVTVGDLVKVDEKTEEKRKEFAVNQERHQEIDENVEEDPRSDGNRSEDDVPAECPVKFGEKITEDPQELKENEEKHLVVEENHESRLQMIGNDGKELEEEAPEEILENLDENVSKTSEKLCDIQELNETDTEMDVIESPEEEQQDILEIEVETTKANDTNEEAGDAEEAEEVEESTSPEDVSLGNSDVFVEEIVEVADSPPVLEQEMTASENIPKLDAVEESSRHAGNQRTELEMPLLLPISKPVPTPSSNCRLTMAQLIERKLQSKLHGEEENAERELGLGVELGLTNGHSNDAEMREGDNDVGKSVDEGMEAKEAQPKKPIIGCVRKSQRKTGRLTRPPWLVENGESLGDLEHQENQEPFEEEEDEEEDMDQDFILPTLGFDLQANLTNGTDMREKLTSQLQMLKGKKKSVALFDAKIPDFTATHYEKRSKSCQSLAKDAVAPGASAFGFKIAAVASGVDLDACAEVKMEVGDDKSVIINDHLDLPTIKLTKTKDYKKIKGWSKKKLLTSDPGVSEPVDEALAGCSYSLDAVKSERLNVEEAQAGNVFASNSLDGFLQEKDLNISYNVPNLKSTNHNINLLDSCVLVDVEEEKRKEKEQEQAELDLLDANSNGSFKDKDKEANVYKPRTLAEKRKMLSDEYDGLDVKKSRGERGQKHKKFSRRPISSRFESNSPAKGALEGKNVKAEKQEKQERVEIKSEIKTDEINDLTLDDDDNPGADDNLLIPIAEAKKPVLNTGLNQIYFLTEEASKPRNCVTSLLKYKSNVKLQSCSVVTRKALNRTFYQKHTDIKRKASFELIPKTATAELDDAKKTPSILTALPVVNYRPGPLCKKQELQVNGSEWETVLINLPKVNVDVRPQIGRKIDPTVRPFIKFETFEVSKGRAEFAISVVRTSASKSAKKDDLKIFQFPTRYQHKQEKLLMRRKSAKGFAKSAKRQKVEKKEYKPESEQEVVDACRSVVSGMLDYVDVKELEDGLLKYDSDAETKVDSELDVTPPSIDDVLASDAQPNKRKRDYDKVFWELKRLNVRTVDLPNDEAQNGEDAKPMVCSTHCRLGCVCQSISSRYPPANHCGETRCLFDCVCGFEARCRNESQEDSRSLLNERTLSRFSKEAKRNITAREERDFTQTAVRSKNKTIILGNSRVSKRTPKYNFKRYEGFQFSFVDESIYRTHSEKALTESYSQKIIRTDRKFKNCVVNIVRCNFDDIVPYCLVHNLYDCHCGGKAKYSHFESHKMNQIQKALKNPHKRKDMLVEEKPTPPATIPPPSVKAQGDGGGGGDAVAGQKTDQLVSNPNGLSARMRGTGEFFRARNKTNKYKTIMARKLKYDSTVDSEIVNRWFILPSEVAGLNKPHGNLGKSRKDAIASIFDNIKMSNKFVLKEEPDVREVAASEDSILVVDDDYSILNSKKIKKPPRKNLKAIAALLTISGALYSPTDAIAKQFAQMINSKVAPLTEFRLLALGSLMNLYNTREVYVWINSAAKMKFIITDSMSNPKGDTYTNIRKFEKSDPASIKVDFIRWIVTKTLPRDRNNENSLVILRIQELYWEICGICAKNVHNSDKAVKTKVEIEHQPEEIKKVDEKYYKTVQHVVFANGTFASKKLVLFDRQDGRKGEMRMEAALPHIVNNCRWRVLKVNSNFAILAFSRNEFRIKCSDILTVMKVSGRYNKTIIINTEEVSANYQHKLFGIYIPPTFQDRIFIGPYLHDEEHGLETLRFVNNELVNTEKFNSMRGISNVATTGLWYQQYGRASGPTERSKDTDCVIDLTDMEEVRSLMKSSDVTITPAPVAAPVSLSATEEKTPAATPSQPRRSLLKKEPKPQPPLEPIAPPPVDLKPGTSASVLKPRGKAKQNGAPPSIEINKFPPPQIPELIRIPLKANKTNKNITQVTNSAEEKASGFNFNMEDLLDIATLENIVKLSKDVDPKNMERCFAAKLRILMKQMRVHLPKGAIPFCFRLNFGNGIVLAYIQNRDVVVFWPGDCQKKFMFISVEAATLWLSKELHEVFICVPSTFKIIVTPVGAAHYMEYINRGVISQKYFTEICVIGDFGIMRLSEAKKYLMYDRPIEAKRALARLEGKSFKFKKAIAQIIDNNDMTKEEFSERVNDLIMKATAAADNPPLDQSRDVPTNCAIPTIVDDVICLDSDDDNDEPPKLQPEAVAEVRKEAPAKRAAKPRKPSEEEVFKRLKSRPSRRFSVDGASRGLAKAKKRPSLPAIENEAEPRREDVMQIDLTHMTTEKVRELLKANEYSNCITLTSKQVKQLKALSRTSGDVAGQNGDAN